jgi:hypothetical protein
MMVLSTSASSGQEPFGVGLGRDDLQQRLFGLHALFPGVGDLGAQVQAVDARVVALEVGPEHAQTPAELLQAGVVDRWLAFPQVVDEQVADGLAGEPVTADHFGGRPLSCGAQLAGPALPGRRSPSGAAAGSRQRCRFWPRRAHRPRYPAALAHHRW